MPVIKTADLWYRGGSSDKVYHLAIHENGPDNHAVEFAYGRRGSSLKYGFKVQGASRLLAEKTFAKFYSEKTAEGYQVSPGISGVVFAGQTTTTTTASATAAPASSKPAGLPPANLPQLLNEIGDDELESYLTDPAWGLMEKKNGVRRMAETTGDGNEVRSFGKKGQSATSMPAIVKDLKKLGIDASGVFVDGEEVGEILWLFDLVEKGGGDYRGKPFIYRYKTLQGILPKDTRNLKVVPLAIKEEDKRALLAKVRKENGEGVVLVNLYSKYEPGRPASGGPRMKHKFYATASVVVLSHNDKRSVEIGVLAGGAMKSVGNVTIPPNKDVPPFGQVIEVRYLYAYPGGSLYQPVYLEPRIDVGQDECVDGQLKYFTGNGNPDEEDE